MNNSITVEIENGFDLNSVEDLGTIGSAPNKTPKQNNGLLTVKTANPLIEQVEIETTGENLLLTEIKEIPTLVEKIVPVMENSQPTNQQRTFQHL